MRKIVLFPCALVLAALVAAAPASAQACSCDGLPSSLCNGQGFQVSLIDFSIDQNAGTSSWDYRVCNDELLDGSCVPPKDLSHVDISLGNLGACLTPAQAISLVQVGGFANAQLGCGVSEKDPSCNLFGTPGSDFVAKCDVVGDDLDPGECVVMRLTIAGEQPTLGAGGAVSVTKAGPECAFDCILGPSCEACNGNGGEDECLTRTPGFWGTHPHITALFLPVTVCGEPIDVVEAGSCASSSEAMCVAPGKESRKNPPYAQLVRQLTAAKLNRAASAAAGGDCGSAIDVRIAECEALCGASRKAISASGCIEDLAEFNESVDTFPVTPPPFDSPGPANPTECRQANGNGIVIGQGACS